MDGAHRYLTADVLRGVTAPAIAVQLALRVVNSSKRERALLLYPRCVLCPSGGGRSDVSRRYACLSALTGRRPRAASGAAPAPLACAGMAQLHDGVWQQQKRCAVFAFSAALAFATAYLADAPLPPHSATQTTAPAPSTTSGGSARVPLIPVQTASGWVALPLDAPSDDPLCVPRRVAWRLSAKKNPRRGRAARSAHRAQSKPRLDNF